MRTRFASAVLLAVCVLGAEARPGDEPASLEDLFDRVHTSVVTLRTRRETDLQLGAQLATETRTGQGSGVLLEGGRILTAAHVVHSADEVDVEYVDGTHVRGRVIGSVVQADLALLQVDEAPPAGVRAAALGDSDGVRVGSRCFVVGAPRGYAHTLTAGYISARRAAGDPSLLHHAESFQTDAAINPGNSGGPMFDMQGKVIGIASWRRTDAEGLSFVVTSNAARRHLLERNPIWSGMTEYFLAGRLARAFQIPDNGGGFLVQRVAKGSPADRLGLLGGSIPVTIGDDQILIGGDIVVAAMGKRLDSPAAGLEVLSMLEELTPESLVTVVVLRGGKIGKLEKPAGELAPWLAKKPAGK